MKKSAAALVLALTALVITSLQSSEHNVDAGMTTVTLADAIQVAGAADR